MEKQCVICNKVFIITSPCQKTCSDECAKINFKQYHKQYSKHYEKSEKRKQYKRLYEKSEKRKRYNQSYHKTDAYMKYRLKRENSIEYKLYKKKYGQTDKRKKEIKEYKNTPKGKEYTLRNRIKRRAFKNNIIEVFSMKEWKDKVKKTKGICPGINGVCFNIDGNDVGISNLVLDHIFPISKANREFKLTDIKRIYTIDDIQPLCKSCNSVKKDKIIKPKGLYTIEIIN